MHLLRNFNFLGGLHGNNRCARLSATCGEQSSVVAACSVVTVVVIIATVSFPGMKINAVWAWSSTQPLGGLADKLNLLLYFCSFHIIPDFIPVMLDK